MRLINVVDDAAEYNYDDYENGGAVDDNDDDSSGGSGYFED